MNTIAINLQAPRVPEAEVRLTVRPAVAPSRFDFGRARKERLLGPAHYLILVRQQRADRARLSWAFRDRTN